MKRFFRLSTITAIALACLSGAALFRISQSVQQADTELTRLEQKKAAETESIKVLRAEWDYLNRPARLEDLAQRYLGMKGPGGENVLAGAADLPDPPAVPDVPGVKPPEIKSAVPDAPVMTPSLAVLHSPPPPVPSPAPAPPPPEPAQAGSSSRSFDSLLNDLSEGGR